MKPEQLTEFKSLLARLYLHQKKILQLKENPRVILVQDKENADKMLGKTAHYEPSTKIVQLNITDRHPKDILRSFAHEIVHHWQHEHKQLNKSDEKDLGVGYAQKDPHMRKMEKQAYLLGNMMFRDWEDALKSKNEKLSENQNPEVKENLEMMSRNSSRKYLRNLLMIMIKKGIISSDNPKLTSGETNPSDFAEELANKLQVALEKQLSTVNWMGDKYIRAGIE